MIATERLFLRRWRDDDRGPFAERGWRLWAVEVPDSEPFIGYVGLWPADYVTGAPMVEVGWLLARPHWGTGTRRRPPERRCASASTRVFPE
jgi:hypothetical protein